MRVYSYAFRSMGSGLRVKGVWLVVDGRWFGVYSLGFRDKG